MPMKDQSRNGMAKIPIRNKSHAKAIAFCISTSHELRFWRFTDLYNRPIKECRMLSQDGNLTADQIAGVSVSR
jgi:hypothetical protein